MTEPALINRMAVTLLPTEAYRQWTRSLPDPGPELTLEELRREATTYLLPATEDPQAQIRRHAKTMLQENLFAWHTDPADWPKDLSLRTFRKFFEVQMATVVLDLGHGPICRAEG